MSFVYRAARNSLFNRQNSQFYNSSLFSSQCEERVPFKSPVKGLSGFKQIIATEPPSGCEDVGSLVEDKVQRAINRSKQGSIYKSYRIWEPASPTQCSITEAVGPGSYFIPDSWGERSKQTTKHSTITKHPSVNSQLANNVPSALDTPTKLSPVKDIAIDCVSTPIVNSQSKFHTKTPFASGKIGTDFHTSKTMKGTLFPSKCLTDKVDYPYEGIVFDYKCKNTSSFGNGPNNNKTLSTESEVILKHIFCGNRGEKEQKLSQNEYQILLERRPGPGDYFKENQGNKASVYKKKHVPFMSGELRHPLAKIQNNLGPTSYHITTPKPNPSASQSSFKSISLRFQPTPMHLNPPVGTYNPHPQPPPNHAMIFSSTPQSSRIFFTEKSDSVPPGYYDIALSELIQKVRENRMPQPAYRNMKERDLWGELGETPGPGEYSTEGKGEAIPEELQAKKVPFLSGCKRFGDFVKEKIVEAEEQAEKQTMKKIVKRKVRLMQGLNSLGPRTKSVDQKPYPTVGHYFNYEQSLKSWNIKSFNKLFNQSRKPLI